MSSTDWNLATMWEAVADAIGDAPALQHRDLERTWSEFDERAARWAAVLGEFGAGHDSKVGLYLYNGPEYLEATYGCFKARSVPVNVNYRYTEHELRYLLENSDAEVVLVDSSFAAHLDAIRDDLPLLRGIVQVGEGPLVPGALRYEEALAAAEPAPRIGRSVDDLWFLYTGGTTGMPKGVMWPQGNLYATGAATFKGLRQPFPETPADVGATARVVRDAGIAPVMLPAAPLMHGTSAIASWGALSAGGTITTLGCRHLDAVELVETIAARRVTNLVIVGDAFAKPIIAAIEERPDLDLSCLQIVISSGVMWSQPVKDALLAHLDVVLADLVGSSEGVGAASSVAKRGRSIGTARFRLGENSRVFTEDGREVEPGSGERGVIAIGGPIPIGYYKDPEKSAGTFRTFGGRVWSVPGDFATVDDDGSIRLLGRGSVCINTAGEKVFPEEVEETLKTHPSVIDANVVGIPDEKWGAAVSAVVSAGSERPTVEELVSHCRATLAGYKCPKHIVFVDAVRRGPNGKADYRWAAEQVAAALA